MQQERVNSAIQQLESLNIDESKSILEQVLAENPLNIEAIDHYTDLLEQIGEVEQMEQVLKKFLNESNKDLIVGYQGSYKLLFKYAQTQNGKTSIQYYLTGIELIQKWLNAENKQLLRDLAEAHAAVAEIYQTDLLVQKESEAECVKHIGLAFQYDPQNLDAFLQLANYHLNKEDEQSAKKELKVIYERLMNVAYEEDSYDEDFKLQVSKVMVEVEDYESAYKILQKAVDQNDKNGELLYMFAFCSWKLQKYVEAMKLVNGILSMGEVKDDQELYQGTLELQSELQKVDFSQCETQQDNEDEWMDVE